MMQVYRIMAVIALAMIVSAASVFGLRDSYIMTPPPESVAESMFDRLAAKRFDQALAVWGSDTAQQPDVQTLRALRARIVDSIGEFALMDTQRVKMANGFSLVTGSLRGERGDTLTFSIPLILRRGQWRVRDVEIRYLEVPISAR